MKLSLFVAAAGLVSSVASTKPIVVDRAPEHVRAYVLPKFKGRAIKLSKTQTITFSITTNSSDGAFSLIQHNGKVSGWLIARPHTHKLTHEHFYCSRGRTELWSMKNATDGNHEARVASFGDYGNVPPDTIHTFQLIDPDSQLSHVFHPAGFEHLFDEFSLGDFDSPVGAPYIPDPVDEQPFGPITPELTKQFARLDLYAAPKEEFDPRRDFVNGSASDSHARWHNGDNAIPETVDPYFVANNYGPKYLNTENGYKVIQPLATPANSEHKNFTMGTIILSEKLHNETASTIKLPHHFALQLDEGQLILKVDGYRSASLLQGDVAFIPANTTFSYHATVPFTRFLYMNAGAQGLEYQLLQKSQAWGFPSYPVFAGYKAQ